MVIQFHFLRSSKCSKSYKENIEFYETRIIKIINIFLIQTTESEAHDLI